MRSSSKFFALIFAAGLATLAGGAEAAGKKDKDVQKLIDQAMDGDYLATEFDKAEQKLKRALDTCNKDSDSCSPELVGKVHVALATVHGGQQKLDVAKGDLINALKADPAAELIADYTTPELEAKFKEAKAEVGGGTGGETGSGGGDGGKGGGTAPPVAGDFDHTPIAESPINTPVPVFAEVPDELGATKVIARYKPYGGAKWESITLEKMEGGFGGLIPCDAVTGAGELRYFISASDESGVLAAAGSLKTPFKVSIKRKITGDLPTLPGQDPPKKCAAKEDCPPGLAGCAGSADGKPLDAICDATPECATGLICLNGVCAPGGEAPPGEKKGTQHVLSLGLQIDAAYVSDGSNVCSASSSASYICTHAEGDLEGQQFFGAPSEVQGTNGISGGLAFSGIRILAGYDYFFDFGSAGGLGLGARVGYSVSGPTLGDEEPAEGNGYPKGRSYLPFHGEARASWKFLHPNPEAGDFAPHAFVGGGYGQANASVPVTVCDELAEPGDNADCPGLTRVNAYQLAGLGFITFGGGVTYMIVRNFGVSAEVKFQVFVPTVGFTLSPTIAPVVAF